MLDVPGVKVVFLLPFGLEDCKPDGATVGRLAESLALVLPDFSESVPQRRRFSIRAIYGAGVARPLVAD